MDKQAEEGTSLETQRRDCLKTAKELQASVVDVLSDEGISGGTLAGCPGILRALALIEEGSADVLLCYDLSRLSRSVEHQAIIKRRVETAGGRLLFVCGQYGDDAEGELHFTIDGGFKQYEKSVIRRRTMKGWVARVSEGLQTQRGVAPMGYHIVQHRDVTKDLYPADMVGRYVVIEEQAEIVRTMFQRYADGDSLREVALWLQRKGVPTRRYASQWSEPVVRGILRNPVYIGQARYGRTERKTDEARQQRGISAAYLVPGKNPVVLACDPIVEVSVWNLVQERMQENITRRAGHTDRKYTLSGLMYCEPCARAMRSHMIKPRATPSYLVYSCPGRGLMHDRKCKYKTHREAHVEALLIHALLTLAHGPERFADAIAAYDAQQRRARQDGAGESLERLQNDLAALDRRYSTVVSAQIDAWDKGRDTEEYDRRLTEIDMKRKEIKARLSALEGQEKPAPSLNYATTGEKIAEVLRRLEAVLTAPREDVTPLEKNGVLSTIVRRIRPSGDGYFCDLRTPDVSSDKFIEL